MIKKIPTVGVVVFKDDTVLLVRKRNHPKHAWQLPGGQIESEKAVDAAKRELQENTDLITETSMLHSIPTVWEARIEKDYGTAVFTFICFVCVKYTGEPHDTETASCAWLPLDALDTLVLNPNTKNAINAGMQLLVDEAA